MIDAAQLVGSQVWWERIFNASREEQERAYVLCERFAGYCMDQAQRIADTTLDVRAWRTFLNEAEVMLSTAATCRYLSEQPR